MNKTVELVKMWGEFEEKNPKASIDDFCRQVLINNLQKKNKPALPNKLQPPRKDIVAMRLMKRLSWYYSLYANKAREGLDIKREEDFFFLNYIYAHKNPRKTDVIYEFMQELATGLGILDGLKTRGLIKEIDDTEDKRSKRLNITAKGEKVLRACIEKFARVNEILLKDLTKDDLRFIIELLQPIDHKFSVLWKEHKGKGFGEIYAEVTGRKEIDEFKNH